MALRTVLRSRLVSRSRTVRRRLRRAWRSNAAPALRATGVGLAAVTTRIAGRLATASRPVLVAVSGPVLRGADRVLRPVGRVFPPAGRVLARAARAAGRAVLAVLPDGTVPALRTARNAVVGFLRDRVAPALRRVGDRVTGMVPAGVRQRMPRRRTLVIGVLAAALVAAGPLSMFVTASKSATPSHAARVADVGPGESAGVKPGAPASGPDAPAKAGKPGKSENPRSSEHASRGKRDGTPADKHDNRPKPPAPPPAPPVPAGLSPAQVENARTIAAVAVKKGLPEHAVTVALATAFQESGLLNLNYGDRDSLGLFQQRPSTGWGSPGQIMNPHYSAAKFFEALVQVPGWQNLPVTVAAQLVQRSAFPDAYAKWAALADSLAKAVLPGAIAGR